MRKLANSLIFILFVVVVFLFFASSCKKDDDDKIQDPNLTHTFTDARDGNVYRTVTIGNQVWMAENLKYLPRVVGPGTFSPITPYYYVYGYDGTSVNAAKATSNYSTCGVLFNWSAAMNVCPTGWHLPSDEEWTQLTDYLGGLSVAAGKLKDTGSIETGTGFWHNPNTGATNKSGFAALAGGYRDVGAGNNAGFTNIGFEGYWWSARESCATISWYRSMSYYYQEVTSSRTAKELGFSVRCVMD